MYCISVEALYERANNNNGGPLICHILSSVNLKLLPLKAFRRRRKTFHTYQPVFTYIF